MKSLVLSRHIIRLLRLNNNAMRYIVVFLLFIIASCASNHGSMVLDDISADSIRLDYAMLNAHEIRLGESTDIWDFLSASPARTVLYNKDTVSLLYTHYKDLLSDNKLTAISDETILFYPDVSYSLIIYKNGIIDTLGFDFKKGSAIICSNCCSEAKLVINEEIVFSIHNIVANLLRRKDPIWFLYNKGNFDGYSSNSPFIDSSIKKWKVLDTLSLF